MRRVVVTGIGLVTPLGTGVKFVWQRMLQGESGIATIQRFDASDLPCKIAGEVPYGDEAGQFNPDRFIEIKEQKKMDRFIHFAVAAATEAVEDSGYQLPDEEASSRVGVMIGSGIGGLPAIEAGAILVHEKGARRLSPFFIPSNLINLASGNIAIKYGYRGPNHAVVTACASGTHALGDAARIIASDDADMMVAGGAESAICNIGIGGFCAARALSTSYNDRPTEASRPFDKARDGFVMGEGAGVVVLEEYEHAKRRGAKIYGELVGYGLSGDAYHITAPEGTGKGAEAAMKMALKKSGMTTADIDYINAHGTSTPLGDEIEVGAVARLFGDDASKIMMSSTKSSIGHLLGAAGAVEAVFSLLAMRDNIAPPTLNLHDKFDGCAIDLVPLVPKTKTINAILSNSFGFGGTNASLIFKKI